MTKMVRLETSIAEAILTVFRHVKETTGNEPSQTEVADALKSYFILNEIANQIKFQRKKQVSEPPAAERSEKDPFWRMNLKAGPAKNSLVRVGIFNQNVKDALITVKQFVKDSGAAEPSGAEIASSLRSSFILSEIKNQIDWQRNDRKKLKKAVSDTK